MAHSHNHSSDISNQKLFWAVIINVLLTVVQIIGGIVSGSLSLLADALHNFSDAAALIIASVAARIAKIPPDQIMTYGYRRAEIIGALINSTTLVLIGLYLIYESISRYQEQVPIDGWIVVIVAGVALVIDVGTAWLTYSGSKSSINIRAAFIHNLSDAMASVVVIVSGCLIILYQVYVIDLVATALISIYVLYHAFEMIRECIKILMQSVPDGLSIEQLAKEVSELPNILGVHHIHVWRLDDKKNFLEGHIKIDKSELSKIEEIKATVRNFLEKKYSIKHSTLEIEVGEQCNNQ